MKGGQISRIWGRQFSFSLAAIFFTTVFFWSWENNPILMSLLSPQEQFVMHTPDLYMDDSESVLLNPKNHVTKRNSEAQLPEGTENHVIEHSDNDVNHKISFSRKREEKSQIPALPSEKQATCNYAKGKWVKDSRRPLYSGFGCKQWLSDMWACRLTQRPDFSYESYRWQPNNCKMPEFHPQEFLTRMQDKTIAFIGDSLGRQQFQSLMCMATGGEENAEVENIGWKFGLVKPKGAVRPDGWAYRFPRTNTTILYYWSASLCNIEPINSTDPNTDFAMHLDRPPFFLAHHLPKFDVVVLNTGHHWNRGKINGNKWVMYADGRQVTDRKLAQIANAKNLTVHSISRWLDSKASTNPNLRAFFRTISPRHFSNGDWNSGGSCDNLTPLMRGGGVSKDESGDPDVESAVRGTKVKILDITALSELRDECHVSRYSIKASEGINDCLHWCLPGIPDTWNELLYAQL